MELDIRALTRGKKLGAPSSPMSEARRKEIILRRSRAVSYAKTALIRLHDDEYRELKAQAMAMIEADDGPLPD